MNFDNFPEISFIDNATLKSIQQELLDDYTDRYEELTGEEIELNMASRDRLILYACAAQIYQTMLNVDKAGKMNFLKYAYGGYLDNLGARSGVTRSQGKAATVTMQFSLSSSMTSAVTIQKGTRATSGDDVYFSTIETVEIAIGETSVIVTAECEEIGEVGNNYAIGTITTLVDPIAYIAAITNIDTSMGGEEIENDESLAERIYLAPSSYSGGTEYSYEYNCKTINTDISDVKISTDSDATVNITFLSNGGIPLDTEVEALKTALYNKDIHVLTDNIEVSAPSPVNYAIDITYYINKSDTSIAESIQTEVNNAIAAYITWQKEKIGRDINPSYLNMLVMDAGAKRCTVTHPVYTVLTDNQVANLTTQSITYGGIEDD